MNRILVLVAALLLVSGISTTQAAPLTLEDVNVIKQVVAVRMSPAGDRIAYLLQVPREIYVDDDGKPYRELHVSDLDGSSTPYVTGDVEITDIAWASDGKSIFFLAKRDEEADFNSLYRIAMTGGEAELLFTHVNSISRVYPSPNGSVLAFTATDAPPEKHKELGEKGFKAVVYEESVLPQKVWMLDLETLAATAHDLAGSASISPGRRTAVVTPLLWHHTARR